MEVPPVAAELNGSANLRRKYVDHIKLKMDLSVALWHNAIIRIFE